MFTHLSGMSFILQYFQAEPFFFFFFFWGEKFSGRTYYLKEATLHLLLKLASPILYIMHKKYLNFGYKHNRFFFFFEKESFNLWRPLIRPRHQLVFGVGEN